VGLWELNGGLLLVLSRGAVPDVIVGEGEDGVEDVVDSEGTKEHPSSSVSVSVSLSNSLKGMSAPLVSRVREKLTESYVCMVFRLQAREMQRSRNRQGEV